MIFAYHPVNVRNSTCGVWAGASPGGGIFCWMVGEGGLGEPVRDLVERGALPPSRLRLSLVDLEAKVAELFERVVLCGGEEGIDLRGVIQEGSGA